ncbi:sensor histidine kinase [Paenibacillus hamazuiensis]|uniref:sensor histidine kinase n=1 Tax=Paenibacillus hamazuiensis TaxID=2936508 RepID=UPI00200D4427|nr:histidine kinase [Paenibacillus hamazuiensis]
MTRIIQFILDPFQRSIRNKLIVTMIGISCVPLIFISLLAAENTRRSVEAEVIESNSSKIEWTAGYLGERFEQMNNIIYTQLINESYNDYIRKMGDANPSIAFNAQKGFVNAVTSIFYSNVNYLSGIQIYLNDTNKQFLVSGSNIEVFTPPRIPEPFGDFFKKHVDFIIENKEHTGVFYLMRTINRFEDRKRLGGIALEINWSNLDNTLNLLTPGSEQTVIIANQQGEILYSLGGQPVSADQLIKLQNRMHSGSGYFRTEEEYVFYGNIPPWNLNVIKVIPSSFINDSARRTWQYAIIIGAVSILLSVLVAIIIAWKTSKPIVKLARAMQGMVPPKEDETPPVTRKDEIGLLEMRYYNMSKRIKEYIKTEYSMNLEKKTAQLKALQAQVNPHFLQNTLQLIGSMAFSKRPDEIYDVIRSLSDMFRYIIRDPEELTTLQQELDHVQNYLHIQKQRFTSRISTYIFLEPGVESCAIPKLTLQPIVENAFIHGLDKKTGAWEIHITVKHTAEGIFILIEDNGVGIPPERLLQLQHQLETQIEPFRAGNERIGLNNVAARIRMHFGSLYGLSIDSQPGKGTAIRLLLPKERSVTSD